MEKEVYNAWVARDRNERLHIFGIRPTWSEFYGRWMCGGNSIEIPAGSLPKQSWANEPKMVKVTIETE